MSALDIGVRDRALVTAALGGDAQAAAEFVARMSCVALFLNSQNRRFGAPLSREALADLAQDAIAVIWGKLASYEGRGPLEAWVYRICALEFMNALRRHARRRRQTTDVHEADPAGPAPGGEYTPSDLLHVRGALVGLSRAEQQVLRLRHYEQHSFGEIAAELALPLNTVKSHYHRALIRLRERLQTAFDEESE